MSLNRRGSCSWTVLRIEIGFATVLLAILASGPAWAQSQFAVLAKVCGAGGITLGKNGTLYSESNYSPAGCTSGTFGFVYQLTPPDPFGPNYSINVLANFSGDHSPSFPTADLIFDHSGMIYGTTAGGGSGNGGTVYQLATDGTLTTLHNFSGPDGADPVPYGRLALDQNGRLYGVTQGGGYSNIGLGVAYVVTASGQESTLAYFTGPNGATPMAGMILDNQGSGALYGTTSAGGKGGFCYPKGCGIIYKIVLGASQPSLTTLYTFSGSDGWNPSSPLIQDAAGNLYGTTFSGGSCVTGFGGPGSIFKLSPAGNLTTLYSFGAASGCTSSSDGANPSGDLALDSSGNLYGTTGSGGSCGGGTIYKLASDGTFATLHNFTGSCGGNDGLLPINGVTLDQSQQFLFGATEGGTVFALKLVP